MAPWWAWRHFWGPAPPLLPPTLPSGPAWGTQATTECPQIRGGTSFLRWWGNGVRKYFSGNKLSYNKARNTSSTANEDSITMFLNFTMFVILEKIMIIFQNILFYIYKHPFSRVLSVYGPWGGNCCPMHLVAYDVCYSLQICRTKFRMGGLRPSYLFKTGELQTYITTQLLVIPHLYLHSA